MTKISQPGISRLENGRYTPSSPLVVVLAKALKIFTDELLGIYSGTNRNHQKV